MKKLLYIVVADHPNCAATIVQDVPYRRQRLSTLYKRFAPKNEDVAVLYNGEDMEGRDLRKVRTRAGDRILFVPRVGFFATFLGPLSVWLTSNVLAPMTLAYGVSYLGGELFGSDLPDSDKSRGGQSFGFNPRSRQIEGGAIEQVYGTVQNHGTIIAKWTDVDATGATAEIIYVLLCLGEGPMGGVIDSQIFLNDRPIAEFSGVTWTERKGTLNQTVITGAEKTKLETRVDQRVTTVGGPVTVTLPRSGFDDIEYTIWFRDGIWYSSKSGHFKGDDFGVTVEVAEVGTESWTELLNSAIASAGQRAPIYKAYSATAQGFSVDRTKQYKLKFTKHRTDHTSTRRPDHLGIRSVRGVVDIAFKYPGKALVFVKAIATADLSGSDIDIKVIHQGKIVAVYNGSSWDYEYSHNRAWVEDAMLTQPVITGDGGATPWAVDRYEGFDPSQIDTAFIYEWSQMCDVQVDDGDGGTEDLSPCHHIFDTKGELWGQAYEIAQIGRANLVWQGTTLTGWIDKAWSSASDLITDENIVKGSWRQAWTKQRSLAGSVVVNFQEAAGGYKRIPWPEHNENAGRYQNKISVEGIGVKTRGHASRVGKFALARNELIREVDVFQMGKDALRYKPGDVHPIQRRKPNWGKSYRVRRYVNANTLELDRTVVAEAGDDLYVRSYNPSTEAVVTKEYTVASISGTKVKITGTITVQPDEGDVVAIGSSTQIKQRRIKNIVWTGDHFFDVTVETYDPTLWSHDSDTPVIPYAGAAPVPVRNTFDRFVTAGEVRQMIEQQVPPALDLDKPDMSNIDWEDNQPSGGSVRWSANDADEDLQIRYKGTTYAITAGNTSNRFIYWIAGNSTFSSTDSETTMQTALLAGAWVVSENDSGTARPTIPLGNVWAGIFRAGSITAALGIIGNLAVDTLQIQDNAVTVLAAAESGASDYLDPSPEGADGFGLYRVAITSPAITATGAPILTSFDCTIDGRNLTSATLQHIVLFRSNNANTKHTVADVTLSGTDSVLIETVLSHGLSTNEHVWMWGFTGLIELNNAICEVTVLTANTFTLKNTRSDWFTAWTSGGNVWFTSRWNTNLVTCPAASYVIGHLETIDDAPDAGVIYEYAGACRNFHGSLYSYVLDLAVITATEVKK